MPAPTLHALLIGADCYLPNQLPEGSYPSLRGCVRDVSLVKEFLRQHLGLSDDRLLELTSTNTGAAEPPEPPQKRPTYENVVAAFAELGRRARKGDHVYVQYSGHGGRVKLTMLPDVKGANAFDEALVPIDVGDPSARYLRDVELARILQDLVARELVVTVVLDSCHSGGATRGFDDKARGVDSAVRGVAFIDEQTARPTGSDVGSVEELRRAWVATVGGDGIRSLTASGPVPGYTLLAACRPSEVANEFAFDGTQRNEALTYWLLDALRGVGPDLTFGMVYNRILPQVRAKFPAQTPMLLGNPGRVVFSDLQTKATFAELVSAVRPDGKLRLACGLSKGLTVGAEFAIYPRTAIDLTRTEGRTALARLTAVRDAESDAEVTGRFGDHAPEVGDQAVLLGVAMMLRRRVRFLDREGKPAADHPSLLLVRQALPGNGWVESVESPDDPADFAVRLGRDDRHYEITNADGAPIRLKPDLPFGGDSPAKMVRRLVHLAKFQAVRELANRSPDARLQKKLRVELVEFPKDFDPRRLPYPEPKVITDPAPVVKVGQWLGLRVTSGWPKEVNLAVLDLDVNWAISQVYPQQESFATVDSKGGPLVFPLGVGLPQGFEEGDDTLKVLATVGPLSVRPLELPALDNPILDSRGTRGPNDSPLNRLLRAIDSPRPTREFAAVSVAGQEWAAFQFTVQVRK